MSSICIIGLGWLGFPLAETLQAKNHQIKGSVRSPNKQNIIEKKANFKVDLFNLYAEQYANTLPTLQCLQDSEVVIINIPPGSINFQAGLYIQNMQGLTHQAFDSGCKHLVFVSTTGVFSKDHDVVTNTSVADSKTPSGAAHIAIENFLSKNYAKRSTIIRPAGLIGPNQSFEENEYASSGTKFRHPIYTLCHKTNIEKGNDPVNLVHLDDVIAVIVAAIEQKCTGQALNVSATEHPTRKEYYEWCAKQLKLPIPGFLEDNKKRQMGKIIDASDTYSLLGLVPNYNSPYKMLKQG